jgi:2-polyprenyl-6-methoxyphenol hydroxylase-like FAD-dependent oxidoreductase
METAPESYFDSVSQIELDLWHQGRVALVGDACQCLTLLAGQGASMAMAGAYLLAEQLNQAEGDYRVAYPAYQQKMKPEIDSRQRQARKLAKSFVPDNRFQIWLTYMVLKLMFLPGFRSLILKRVGAKSIVM